MIPKPVIVILSCEHAVDTIPAEFQHYFTEHAALLNSHRGIDFGAAAIARHLSQSLNCYLHSATISRLLIDYNRTLNQQGCFSEISNTFSDAQKQTLIESYYQPYRQHIIEQINTRIAEGYQVWHLSMHSFTPVMDGVVRQAEIGLLYDPQRASEKRLVQRWQRLLKSHDKHWRTRLNYPYKGTADGFTTTLRSEYAANDYLGIEIECNQALMQDMPNLARMGNLLECTLLKLLPFNDLS